jgi:hypothetical protein
LDSLVGGARVAITRIRVYAEICIVTERSVPRMKSIIAAFLFLSLSGTIAGALDMADLAPCRPAAARFCDRTGGMTWSNLLRCSATLAAHSFRLGNGCREVLRRYGQL